ncbi:MAG: hydroxymethylbilane synthase, partial [Flavisolibacter sp.]|nr:hydroxymethylbilane synthase [Flavisolibacter sp.]
LVYIKSEGDVDTVTPLYALGVQGVFTKALDAALLNNRIDLAVHSMKDVPTQLAQGIKQAAVLKRASHKDIFVYKNLESIKEWRLEDTSNSPLGFGEAIIATSSIRRIAQWLHRYPNHQMVNLRGNVNTRLRKLKESNWNGAIFAAAGLERIDLRPQNSIDLDWMLPAPAQGAIMVVCREDDGFAFEACQSFNDAETALCTKIEREFLRTLLGGCSTPISALAEVKDGTVYLKGNIVSPDGKHKIEVTQQSPISTAAGLGVQAANELLAKGGDEIVGRVRKMKTPDGKV